MKKLKAHILKLSLILFLGFHLILHVLYLAPITPATLEYKNFVNSYINTFFEQNWHLFAPEPATSSLYMVYRCGENEVWKNPYLDLIREHKPFPLTAKGKMSYVYQNLAREIYNAKLKKVNDKDIHELILVKKFLANNCPVIETSEVEIQRIFTINYSKRFNLAKENPQKIGLKFIGGEPVWN